MVAGACALILMPFMIVCGIAIHNWALPLKNLESAYCGAEICELPEDDSISLDFGLGLDISIDLDFELPEFEILEQDPVDMKELKKKQKEERQKAREENKSIKRTNKELSLSAEANLEVEEKQDTCEAIQCLTSEVADRLVALDDKQLEYFKGIECHDLEALKACTEETLRATGFYDEDIKAIEVLDSGSLMLLKTMNKKNDVNRLRCQTCLTEETYQALRAWGTEAVHGLRSE